MRDKKARKTAAKPNGTSHTETYTKKDDKWLCGICGDEKDTKQKAASHFYSCSQAHRKNPGRTMTMRALADAGTPGNGNGHSNGDGNREKRRVEATQAMANLQSIVDSVHMNLPGLQRFELLMNSDGKVRSVRCKTEGGNFSFRLG